MLPNPNKLLHSLSYDTLHRREIGVSYYLLATIHDNIANWLLYIHTGQLIQLNNKITMRRWHYYYSAALLLPLLAPSAAVLSAASEDDQCSLYLAESTIPGGELY